MSASGAVCCHRAAKLAAVSRHRSNIKYGPGSAALARILARRQRVCRSELVRIERTASLTLPELSSIGGDPTQ